MGKRKLLFWGIQIKFKAWKGKNVMDHWLNL
jgi:hypothetical protein